MTTANSRAGQIEKVGISMKWSKYPDIFADIDQVFREA